MREAFLLSVFSEPQRLYKMIVQNLALKFKLDCRESSLVKSVYCSFRGPEFSFQNLHQATYICL